MQWLIRGSIPTVAADPPWYLPFRDPKESVIVDWLLSPCWYLIEYIIGWRDIYMYILYLYIHYLIVYCTKKPYIWSINGLRLIFLHIFDCLLHIVPWNAVETPPGCHGFQVLLANWAPAARILDAQPDSAEHFLLESAVWPVFKTMIIQTTLW